MRLAGRWAYSTVLAALVAGAAVADLSVAAGVVHIDRAGPGGKALYDPSGVSIDSRSNQLFISDTGNNRVVITSLGGVFRFAFASPTPSGCVLGPQGRLYVVGGGGSERAVRVYDARGRQVDQIRFGEAPKVPYPTAIAMGPGGALHVADGENDRIWVFAADGSPADWWPVEGVDRAADGGPACLAVADDGRCAVGLGWQAKVQVYSPDGELQKELGSPGGGTGGLVLTAGLTFDQVGRLHVVDCRRGVVQTYSRDGRLLAELAGFARHGTTELFWSPRGVAAAPDGTLYVALSQLGWVEGVRASPLAATAGPTSGLPGDRPNETARR